MPAAAPPPVPASPFPGGDAPSVDPIADLLDTAQQALRRGELLAARAAAEAARTGAVAQRDRLAEAEALRLRADAERWLSLFPAARASAHQAALLSAALDDLAGEIRALILLAHVSGALACYEDALDAALLATELSRPLASTALHAEAQNYLGLVHEWLGQADAAERAFRCAEQVADRTPDAGAIALRARANQCGLTMVGLRDSVRQGVGVTGLRPALTALRDRCRRVAEEAGRCDDARASVPARTFSQAIESMALTWLREPDAAAQALGRARQAAEPFAPGWLDVVCLQAQVEMHLMSGNLALAERCAQDILEAGIRIGHERAAGEGHLMVAHILEARGNVAAALREMHRLQQRQRRTLADRTEARQFVVSWRLALRDEQQRVRRLERSSRRLVARHRRLERLSMEDALTGLLNRRGIEQEADGVRSAGGPLTVAMIDVDEFKRINDTCSHAAGDQVLRRLAHVMRVQTRSGDVVGRLAGDEFLILFPGTRLAEATAVCERLTAAIGRVHWDTMVPGIGVSVSLGLAEQAVGEPFESVLARADARMYEAKKVRKSPSVIDWRDGGTMPRPSTEPERSSA